MKTEQFMAHKKRQKHPGSKGSIVVAETSEARVLSAMPVVINYYSYIPLVSFEKRGIDDAVFRFKRPDDPEFRNFRAYAIRDAFELVKSPVEAFEFLSATGVFCFKDEAEGERQQQETLTWKEFQHWQDFVRHVRTVTAKLKSSFEDPWELVDVTTTNHVLFEYDTHLNQMTIEPGRSSKPGQRLPLKAFLHTRTTLEALAATVFLDRLAGARYQACRLKDCPRLFEITSRHKREYCDEDCAHKASVRRRRAMEAKLKAKEKARHTKRKAN